jgi:DNA-binding SARP family transcriptional activator/WD40 repeat protein/energy-coupling factor transporter ATP-binding protein EcfA2
VDFGVLGSLSVTERARVIALGGPIQRRLLAALIAHAPQPVSTETLVVDVWGEAAPATAVRTLHSHVARLRDALGRDSSHAIQTIDSRYLLPLSREDVDAWVFEDLVLKARSDGVGPREASIELRRALDLWRGPAYGEFAGAPFADAESRRLESLREQALESAIYADLEAGRGAELVPELESLVIEHPFRERMWSALVVALYRAGRQADALDAYQRARSLLGDELGVDPGPELRAVEAKVLAQDPSLLAATPTRVPTCPWKGLSTYEPGDADFFVGRDAVVSEVIARLVDYSVVIVTGPSGSGKSSLVRAGVIPALREGAIIGSGDWRVSLLSPGTRPLDAVRTALSEASNLLVIDPGDDLLTVSSSDEVVPIAEALRDGIARGLRIMLTLRGDLYGRLTELNTLAPRAGAGTVLVGPPSDEELRQVVELPARRVGLDVDQALVHAVISDVGGRPAALPLLSTALVRTWERREGSRLTLAGYLAAGGTSSALERLAEEAYAAMDDEERVAARRILLRLVVSDDGLWRRRRVSIVEAVPDGDAASRRALFSLSDNRLVSLDGEVQLSHEALTSAWPRFASWLSEREQSAGVFDHLTRSARAWQAGGRDDGDLYRGARLQAALDLEASQPDELGPTEHEFIASSRSAAEQEITRLRRGRRLLVVVAAGLVILLALASVAGVLAVRSRNDAAAAAVRADAQRVGLQALTRTDVAQKLLLAVAAVRLDDGAGTQSSLLTALQDAGGAATTVALAAPATAVSVSSDGWIGVAESNGHVEDFSPTVGLRGDQEPATQWTQGTPTGTVAWLDGHDSMLVGATDPSRVFSLSPSNGGVSTFGTAWNPYVFGVTGDHAWGVGTSTSPDAHGGVTLLARDARDAGNAAKSVSVQLSAVPIALVPGPEASVTAIERGVIERVDVALATVTSSRPLVSAGVVVASIDGRHVAVAGADGTVTLVDLQTGTSREPIPRLDAPLALMALSSDGEFLAGTAARDSTIHVWSTASGVERATFRSTLGDVGAMGWSPDGQHLITTPTAVAALQDWDLSRTASPTHPRVAQGPPGSGHATATAVSPETATLAVGTDQGRPWFLHLDTGRVSTSKGPAVATSKGPAVTTSKTPAVTAIVSVAFAEHGSLAITADAHGVLALWDPATGELLANLTQATRVDTATDVSRAPVSSDGRQAASFVDGFGLQLVDLDRRALSRPVYPDLGLASLYRVLGWSADGQNVIVGAQGVSDSPAVWALVDPRTGRVLWRTDAPEQVAAADVVNAEDGRTIVVPGASGKLYFLDAATGAPLVRNAANTGRTPAVNDRQTPASVSVSPGGQQLSVVSAAHPVEIWDVAAGEQSGTIAVPGSTIAAHFMSDHQLVTATVGGAVSVIDLSVSDWVDLACRGAGRELSRQEWSQFLPTHPYEKVCAGKTGAKP